jgi:NitT/TauT family transport system permease protein
MLKSRLFQTVVPPLVTLVLVIGLLEAGVRGFNVKPYICVPPSAVFLSLIHDHDELLKSTIVTAKEVGIGFAVSVTFGVTAAVILSLSKWVERAFYPYAIFFQTVPLVAIVPLLGPWFGYGMPPVVASAFIASVFPVVANTLTGLLSVDPAHRDMFKLYRAGRIATLFKLNIPSALPNILTGFRIAAGLVVVGTIVGEYMISFSKGDIGLGQFIIVANRDANFDRVYAAVLLSSLLGLILFGAVNLVGYLALRNWHASEQRD